MTMDGMQQQSRRCDADKRDDEMMDLKVKVKRERMLATNANDTGADGIVDTS